MVFELRVRLLESSRFGIPLVKLEEDLASPQEILQENLERLVRPLSVFFPTCPPLSWWISVLKRPGNPLAMTDTSAFLKVAIVDPVTNELSIRAQAAKATKSAAARYNVTDPNREITHYPVSSREHLRGGLGLRSLAMVCEEVNIQSKEEGRSWSGSATMTMNTPGSRSIRREGIRLLT
ncbi:hypothetical protein Tco_0202068 [Tanacetum coccineum]